MSIFLFHIQFYNQSAVNSAVTYCRLSLIKVTQFDFRSLGALGRALGPVVASVLYWLAGPELCYSIGGLALTIPYFMLKRCN